jgi:TRIAP1/MDM35 family protein
MNSLGEECNDLKQSYDACFNLWFAEKFLKGDAKADDVDMCKPIFLVYRECVRVSGLSKTSTC